MNKEEIEKMYYKYMKECGIPSMFFTQRITSEIYGSKGAFFGEIFLDEAKRDEYFNAFQVLNIYGSFSEELLYGISRCFTLHNKTVRVLTPSELADSVYDPELPENEVIALTSFYVSGYSRCPIPESDIYQVERFLQKYIYGKKKLVLIANSGEFQKTGWYSQKFVNALAKYTKDLNSDTGN